MQQRYTGWAEIDQTMNAYIPLTSEEKKLKATDKRRPVSIVVPSSYAILQTLLTYMVQAFLPDNMFRYAGVGPEDIPKALIMESLVLSQLRKSKAALALHTMWSDAYKYNCGIITTSWVKDVISVSTLVEEDGLFARVVKENVSEKIRFEGNKLNAIDPYDFLPDTNYPIHEVENMEYVGWVERGNYAGLILDEEQDSLKVNGKFVKFIDGRSQILKQDFTGRHEDPEKSVSKRSTDMVHTSPVDKIRMYIDLIPFDWDLGKEDGPETWFFELSGDEIITQASPAGLVHGLKPISVASPDFDGHNVAPLSRLEVEAGMQNAINFLYNMRMGNIKKSMNNMIGVDPGIINYEDVLDTKEGMVVRTRKSMWGLGKLKDGILPINVQDITAGNMTDMQILMQLKKDTSGAPDIVGGSIPKRGERVSASEANTVSQGAFSRLEKDAMMMWTQVNQPVGEMCASNVINEMEQETYVKAVGRLAEDIAKEYGLDVDQQRILADPKNLADVAYDLETHDGSIPGGSGDSQSMIQFVQILAQLPPEVAAEFDFFRIAKSVGRKMNIKDVETWVRQGPAIQPEVQPTADVVEGVRKGDLVNVEDI